MNRDTQIPQRKLALPTPKQVGVSIELGLSLTLKKSHPMGENEGLTIIVLQLKFLT
jgi:hypothetical protein